MITFKEQLKNANKADEALNREKKRVEATGGIPNYRLIDAAYHFGVEMGKLDIIEKLTEQKEKLTGINQRSKK